MFCIGPTMDTRVSGKINGSRAIEGGNDLIRRRSGLSTGLFQARSMMKWNHVPHPDTAQLCGSPFNDMMDISHPHLIGFCG
jgi:hypothetical protein